MAGSQISIIRKTPLSVGITATASQTTEMVLAPLVDTVGWVSGVCLWRVFTTSAFPTSATLNLVLQNAMVGPDDPNTVLYTSTDLLAVPTAANITTSTSLLYANAIPAPIGRYLRVVLRGLSAGTAGKIDINMALDLVGRSA